MAQQEKLERMSTQLSREEKAELYREAAENGRTAAAEARMAIRHWLRRKKK